jgi:hypothetical protein
MDVKEGNIFIDVKGTWWLGDFGSCVYVNDPVTSTTISCYPVNVIGLPAKFRYDFYMLCVALADRMDKVKLDWETLDIALRERIRNCVPCKLKSLMEELLYLHESGM